jgi:hypothetical protein
VWENPFKVPQGYDPIKLEIAKAPDYIERTVYFNQLRESTMQAYKIFVDGEWKKPELLDYNMIIFSDGTDRQYKQNEQILVRIPTH